MKSTRILSFLVEHYKIKTDIIRYYLGGARGVMVIVTGYGHGDTSSIPGQD